MELIDGFDAAQHHQPVPLGDGIVAAGGHIQLSRPVPDGNDVHMVPDPDVQLPDGLALPPCGSGQLHDAEIVRELDKVEHIGAGQALGQLQAHLMLREYHPVGADLLQHLAVDMALGLAHHLLHPGLLQVQGDEGAVPHVAAGGHDGAVKIAHSQSPQHRRVLGVPGHRVGHLLGHLLHPLAVGVDGQHFMAQAAQLGGHRAAKAPQADHYKGLHTCFKPPCPPMGLSDHKVHIGIPDPGRLSLPGEEGDGEGEHSHPAQIHKEDEQPLGRPAQPRRDPRGEAHGAQGGGHLKGAVQIGQSLQRREGDRPGAEQTHHHQRQGHGVEHPLVGHRPAPHRHLFPARQAGPEGQQQHRQRHRLDAARRGAGRAADEHQHHRQSPGTLPQPPLSQAVKARGAQRDRLEQGVEQLLPQGHGPQGGGIVVLGDQREYRPQGQQSRRHSQHQLAVQGQPPPAPGPDHVLPHKEAQASHHDEDRRGQQDHRVVPYPRQAGKGPISPAQQVEARVAEGGHRVEDPPPQPPCKAETGDEPGRQQRRTGPLQEKGPHQRPAHHPHHAVQVVQVKGGDHDEPLGQADPAVEGQGHHGDDRHEAQPSQLDHDQDHPLAEQAPLEPGVRQDKTRHAGSRGGGEQCGKKSGALSVPGGQGQRQQQASQQNDAPEGGCHDAGGIHAPAAEVPLPQPAERGRFHFHVHFLISPAERDMDTQKGTDKEISSLSMPIRGRARAGRGLPVPYCSVQRFHGREYYLGIIVTSHKFL